jgi:hypothetical protein
VNVLVISWAWDTGGQGSRIAEAFVDERDWNVRSMAHSNAYMAYPVDLPYRRRSLEEQYQAADVIHVRNHFGDYDRLAKKYGAKPVVIHYHGSRFRANPNRHIVEQRKRGAIGVVSTLDLFLLAPDDLQWLPAPYDVDQLQRLRQ